METVELTLRLPQEEVELATRYAQEHGMTLADLIGRYLRHLRAVSGSPIHPEVEKIAGLISADLGVEDLYRDHLIDKHQ